MILEAVAFSDVLTCRDDLEVFGDVQAGDPLAVERDDVIDVIPSSAVHARTFGVHGLNSRLIGPRRGAVDLACSASRAGRSCFDVMLSTKSGSFVVEATSWVRCFPNPETALMNRAPPILHAFLARAHVDQPAKVGASYHGFRAHATRMTNSPHTPGGR